MPLTALRGKSDRDRDSQVPTAGDPPPSSLIAPRARSLGCFLCCHLLLDGFVTKKKILWENETLPHKEFKSWDCL